MKDRHLNEFDHKREKMGEEDDDERALRQIPNDELEQCISDKYKELLRFMKG
jgi:hypothetical protein